MHGIVWLFVLVLASASAAFAQTPQTGDEVELRATHHLGVPLHKQAGGLGGFDRVADGAHARVIEVQQNNRWFNVTVQDGHASRYAAR